MSGKIFIQNWGSYSAMETLVVCGVPTPKAVLWMKRKKVKERIIHAFQQCYTDVSGSTDGSCLHVDGATLIWLPEWKPDWNHYETLMHELNHAIWFGMVKHMGMSDETDAQAYQQVYLFQNIRKKLDAQPQRKPARRKNERRAKRKAAN